MNDGEFEKFRGGPTQSPRDRIYVSIYRSGFICFNNNCYRLLGKPPAAYLHYSRVTDTIAVEPIQSHRLPAAFPVREKSINGWRINASPFCKHFNIRIDATTLFISPEIRDGKLHLKLSETITVRQIRRKRTK